MELVFYSVSDDPRKVQKTLGTAKHTIQNASVYENCSIMNPSFLVDYSASIIETNYVKATLWNRYYFIRDFIAMPGGRCRVICDEDVLMGNAEDILKLNCNIIRQEYANAPYVIDRMMLARADTKTTTKEFTGNPFSPPPQAETDTAHRYLITIVGGKSVPWTPPTPPESRGDSNGT